MFFGDEKTFNPFFPEEPQHLSYPTKVFAIFFLALLTKVISYPCNMDLIPDKGQF